MHASDVWAGPVCAAVVAAEQPVARQRRFDRRRDADHGRGAKPHPRPVCSCCSRTQLVSLLTCRGLNGVAARRRGTGCARRYCNAGRARGVGCRSPISTFRRPPPSSARSRRSGAALARLKEAAAALRALTTSCRGSARLRLWIAHGNAAARAAPRALTVRARAMRCRVSGGLPPLAIPCLAERRPRSGG